VRTHAAIAGVDVHDRAAGEIERAHLRQPSAAPDPVRDRRVDDDRPQRDEGDVAEKRMRSTIDPEMSAAVMMANVAWYDMYSSAGWCGPATGSSRRR
jgi:hypothetical protein